MAKRELVQEVPLMVKLDAGLKMRLKITAARERTDMSKIVREALAKHLDHLDRTAAKKSA